MISLFITVSRHWTLTHGYTSFDFTIDTFFMMGLAEIPYFLKHAREVGYPDYVMAAGLGAAFGQIFGTILMIYAATKGLAGPSSAMVQVQGLFHTSMSAVFLNMYPNSQQCVGLLCSMAGAIVMAIEMPCIDRFSKSAER